MFQSGEIVSNLGPLSLFECFSISFMHFVWINMHLSYLHKPVVKVTKMVKIMPQLIFLLPVKFYFLQNLSIYILLLGLGISSGIWKSFWKLPKLVDQLQQSRYKLYLSVNSGGARFLVPFKRTPTPPHYQIRH